MRDDPFNDGLIVRYLLGDLPEAEQVEIEDRAFQDRQYLQQILAVESDLIDDYVRGELSDSERRLFDSRFLASAERRRKVEFARSLASVLSRAAIAKQESRPAVVRAGGGLWRSFAGLLGGLNPAARLAFAAAVLLIVAGGAWLITETMRLRAQVVKLRAEQQSRQQDQQALEGQVADERARREDLSSRLQSEREQGERREALLRELEREREESATKPEPPAVFSFALLPGIARGGSARPQLVLPPAVRLVRLQVGIEPEEAYKRFRVELRTQAGQSVWRQDDLTARTGRGGRAIVVTLPAGRLGAGPYELALRGVTDDGKSEDVAFYYFDVLKR